MIITNCMHLFNGFNGKLSSSCGLLNFLKLFHTLLIHGISKSFVEDFINLFFVKYRLMVANMLIRIHVHGRFSVCKHNCYISFLKFFCITWLVTEMGECDDGLTCGNEFESTSKPTMCETCFQCRMRKYFNLRNPWSNPEVFVVIIWQLKLLFQTPYYFAAQLYQSLVNGIDTPLLPEGYRSK